MLDLARDLRLAVRALRRTPGFTATAITIFALASGAVIAAFAVIHGVLFRPLPLRDQDRLVIAWKEDYRAGFAHFPFTHQSTDLLRRELTTVSDVATVDYNGAWPLSTVDGDVGVKLPTGGVSGDFFRVLGVEPVIGRLFRPEEDVIGGAHLLVISEKLWRSRYGGNPSVIGRKIVIYGIPHEIVGVVPADFEYPRGAIAWTLDYPWSGTFLDEDLAVTQDLVVRLKPGVTLAQFTAELERLRSTSPLETRSEFATHRVVTRWFVDDIVGDLRPMLWLLAGGALLVLVVASANMGSLLLVRTGNRLHEIAIRAAIGASRRQVWRAVALEYGVVVIAGVVASLLVAWAALLVARSALPVRFPRAAGFTLTGLAAAVGAALSLTVATIGGLASASVLVRANFAHVLRAGGRSGVQGWGTHPIRRVMVAVQLGLAMTAVTGAGLLVRTLDRLRSIELGLDPKHLLFGDVTISVPADSALDRRALEAIDRMIEAIERVPGVVSAATTFSPPFVGNGGAYSKMRAEGQPESRLADMPLANRESVTPGYFSTMGMVLRRGRFFQPSDRERAPPVVIINEAMARLYWPGQDPIGRRLGYAGTPVPVWRTVVGVVANTRYNSLRMPSPAIYVPYRQIEERPWYLLIRTVPGARADDIASGSRRVIRELGLGIALVSATPMATLLAEPLGAATTTATLTGGFALVALVLAALGLYGVLSSFVVQRTREFGVRMALGADSMAIAGLVVRQGSRLIGIGVAGGLLASVLVGRGLTRFLYQVTPSDPVTFVAVAGALAVMGFFALLAPALRATKVDPIVSLRSE